MVDEIRQKATKTALTVGGIFFLFSFLANFQESVFSGIINGAVSGVILGAITFLISKSVIKNKVKFSWWQWIFYVIGWFTGFANLVFWIIMYAAHMIHNNGEPFFNKNFHRRVYLWGIVMTVLLIIVIIMIYYTPNFDDFNK